MASVDVGKVNFYSYRWVSKISTVLDRSPPFFWLPADSKTADNEEKFIDYSSLQRISVFIPIGQ